MNRKQFLALMQTRLDSLNELRKVYESNQYPNVKEFKPNTFELSKKTRGIYIITFSDYLANRDYKAIRTGGNFLELYIESSQYLDMLLGAYTIFIKGIL